MKALPSSNSAAALVSGDLSALPVVGAHLVGRGALLWTGMRLAGLDAPAATRAAVAGTVSIEFFALAWFAWQRFMADA